MSGRSIEFRTPMPTLSVQDRTTCFDEVALGYDFTLAQREAARCLNCKNPPCEQGCPVGVKIPLFISQLKDGDPSGALRTIRLDNNLPAICGRVCPQENQCEKFCVRKEKLGGSVAIGNLERFAADFGKYELYNTNIDDKLPNLQHILQKLNYSDKTEFAQSYQSFTHSNALTAVENASKDLAVNPIKYSFKGERLSVAIVGSGPASLSCAADLARAGAGVDMFEALHKAGGVLRYGIPEFRLPKTLVDSEVDFVRSLGVRLYTDVVIGKTIAMDELLRAYDAVFIGAGAGLPSFLNISGENLIGVYSANEYLTRVNLMQAYKDEAVTPILTAKRVVVVGAGNVAMDCARTALRLGGEVTLAYRRGRQEMPAREEEIARAEEEGVNFMLLVNPVEILGEDGKVRGMRLIRMTLGEPDSSGRRRPVPKEGSEFDISCEQVIVALGTSPNPIIKNSAPDLEVSAKGTIVADDFGRTSIPRIYAGGDATTGAATVIQAMGAGKRAAKAILSDFDMA